jgi:hypothetical protein
LGTLRMFRFLIPSSVQEKEIQARIQLKHLRKAGKTPRGVCGHQCMMMPQLQLCYEIRGKSQAIPRENYSNEGPRSASL